MIKKATDNINHGYIKQLLLYLIAIQQSISNYFPRLSYFVFKPPTRITPPCESSTKADIEMLSGRAEAKKTLCI